MGLFWGKCYRSCKYNMIRFLISLLFARLSSAFLKITKLSPGTSIIGLFVLKICPDFLKYANNYILSKKINITGTNGKTTTSGLINHLKKIRAVRYKQFYGCKYVEWSCQCALITNKSF